MCVKTILSYHFKIFPQQYSHYIFLKITFLYYYFTNNSLHIVLVQPGTSKAILNVSNVSNSTESSTTAMLSFSFLLLYINQSCFTFSKFGQIFSLWNFDSMIQCQSYAFPHTDLVQPESSKVLINVLETSNLIESSTEKQSFLFHFDFPTVISYVWLFSESGQIFPQ